MAERVASGTVKLNHRHQRTDRQRCREAKRFHRLTPPFVLSANALMLLCASRAVLNSAGGCAAIITLDMVVVLVATVLGPAIVISISRAKLALPGASPFHPRIADLTLPLGVAIVVVADDGRTTGTKVPGLISAT